MAKREIKNIVRIIVLVVILLAANAFLGYSLAKESEHALTEQIQARMLDVACSAAELLDGDSLETLKAEDAGTPAYEQAMSTLRAFQDNVNLSYIYCVREVGEKSFVFTVDPTVGDPADFGEPVEYTEALGSAAAGTPAVDSIAYEDRWGRFYSAYCPVFDSKGKVASIVAVDFAAAWYEEHTAHIDRLVITSCLASLILALIAVIVVARMSRAEAEHIEGMLKVNRYDSLTGLANMGYFFELATEARKEMLAKDEVPAMLYMGLVGMKLFNQKRGFSKGDDLLKAFADLLAKHFSHERCSRFGQDQFAVSTNAEGLDARINAFIEELPSINGGKSLPVRIGVYLEAPGDDIDVGTACDRAKAASMDGGIAYRSVCRYFSPEMMERVQRRQYFVDNLDRAISEGWIVVYYQPIVRASTGKVCDEEALARWVDPELGTFMPSEFVPVLEDAKLAHKLDLCVLGQMLEKMKRMADAGLHVVSASVNLSRNDFETCDIVEEVRKCVDEAGIERSKINVEITETAIGLDFDFMKEQVERFHDLGFHVWMDDFGSEYSSLDYLQNLPFDLLKLDMSFMQRFDSGEKSKVIVTELVRMAMGLGIDTVAEGVETEEQVEFLRDVGCSKLQGFYFTEPHSPEEILKRYEDGTAIGFEDPAESEYYAALGSVNLYDLSSIARGHEEGLQNYFDMLPMAVAETMENEFAIMRCNKSYLEFMKRVVGNGGVAMRIPYTLAERTSESGFIRAIRECGKQGGRIAIDETMENGYTVHAFANRIAVNPVTGASAVAVAVLAVTSEESEWRAASR